MTLTKRVIPCIDVDLDAAEAARNGDVRILSGSEILRAGKKATTKSGGTRSEVDWLRLAYRLLLVKGLVAVTLIIGGLALAAWLPGHLSRTVQGMFVTSSDTVTTAPASLSDDSSAEPSLGKSRESSGESGNSTARVVPDGIYRWRDDDGTVTYGDSPPEGVAYERLRGKMDERNVVKSYGY